MDWVRPDPHHTQEKLQQRARSRGIYADWVRSRPHHTQEKAESEKVRRWTGWVSRPLTTHTREVESEKVRYGGLGARPDPTTQTREGREREGEV
jgi:hypothetical protein